MAKPPPPRRKPPASAASEDWLPGDPRKGRKTAGPDTSRIHLPAILISAGVASMVVAGAFLLSDDRDESPHHQASLGARPGAQTLTVAARANPGILAAKERQYLLFMREEEKLALDLYMEMHRLWGLSVFKSVSGEEKEHMRAMLGLLRIYNLPDPVGNNPPGRFVNAHLRDLYQSLARQGSQSVEEALKACALQEEINMLDLMAASNASTQPKIREIYSELQRDSINHLRSFAHALEVLGVRYQGVKIPQQTVDAIIHGPMDRGFLLRKQ